MLRALPSIAFLLSFILTSAVSAQRYQAGDIVLNFTLVDRKTGEGVSLSDFEGKIVFLEWFAYWCPFCQAAAADVEVEIVEHYRSRGGNPNGVPVVHVGLNLQADAETLSQQFIDEYGIELVLNDFDRALANRFQPANQPIFAIINGVANSPSHEQWELLLTHLGYGQSSAPTTTFRQAIDSVQAAAEGEPPTISLHPQGAKIPTGAPFELTIEAVSSSEASYSWSKDGTPLLGESAATLTVDVAELSDGGIYFVTVFNAFGQAVSEAAALVVVPSLADFLEAADVPSELRAADDDPDRDGWSNVFEYLADTHPLNRTETPDTEFRVSTHARRAFPEFYLTRSGQAVGFSLAAEFNSQPDFAGEAFVADSESSPTQGGGERLSIRCEAPLGEDPIFGRLVVYPD